MPFIETAVAAAKMALKETGKVVGKETLKKVGDAAVKAGEHIVAEALVSGQKDVGWAGEPIVKSLVNLGTDIAGDGLGLLNEIGGDGYKADMVPELKSLPETELSSKPEIFFEKELPSELKILSNPDIPFEPEISFETDLPSEIPSGKIDAVAGETSDVSEKKGGSYKEVKENSDGDTHEVHHMPADSASTLERNDGPAIKMEKEDHRQTASCGSSREAREYRARQQELIEQGKFREALQMDIDDIHDKFGDKYDDAISEMMDYVDKLEQEGKING